MKTYGLRARYETRDVFIQQNFALFVFLKNRLCVNQFEFLISFNKNF